MKPGDKIHYVREIIVNPTHVQRGNRMVRVRYEAKKAFRANTSTVEAVHEWGVTVAYSESVRTRDICETAEEAQAKSAEKTKAYKEHCEFSSRCR